MEGKREMFQSRVLLCCPCVSHFGREFFCHHGHAAVQMRRSLFSSTLMGSPAMSSAHDFYQVVQMVWFSSPADDPIARNVCVYNLILHGSYPENEKPLRANRHASLVVVASPS